MADKEFSSKAKEAILAYDRAGAEDVARRALAAGMSPAEIMASGFIPGIQELGDLFESGEVFLPELMMAAQAMEGATMVCNATLAGAAAS
jgi:methanogenic corrinoid protein MtbC1